MVRFTLLVFATLQLSGCAALAIASAPDKRPVQADDPEIAKAQEQFWATLHGGNYPGIPDAIELLQRVYLRHPEMPGLGAHLAFLHVWRAAERSREPP